MTNLVSRLRAAPPFEAENRRPGDSIYQMCAAAADEIERLERDLAAAKLLLDDKIALRHPVEPTESLAQTHQEVLIDGHTWNVSDCPKCNPEKSTAEPPAPKPDGYAYRYHGYRGDTIRFSGGERVNGSEPFEAVPYFFGSPEKYSAPPEKPGYYCGLLRDDCKDEFCPAHGQDIR